MQPQAPVPNRMGRRPSFGAGEIFSRSFGVWFAQLPSFLLLTLVIFSPLVVYMWLTLHETATDPDRGMPMGQSIVLEVGGALLGSALAAAFSYGVFRRLQKQPAGVGESIVRGLASVPAVLGVIVVRGLGIAALALPASFVGAGGILDLLLHIPSYWLATVWSAAVPAAVIEKLGIGPALARSTDLTSGYRGTIFGAWILIGLVFVLVVVVLTMIAIQALKESSAQTQVWAVIFGVIGTTVLISSLQAVTQAVIYHGLRMRKEGVTADELIRAFA